MTAVIAAGFVGGPLNVMASDLSTVPDRSLAGSALQTAAAFAGVIGCLWAASTVLDERDRRRLEMTVAATPDGAWLALGKLLAYASALGLAGVTLALMLAIQRSVQTGTAMGTEYAAAFAFIYVPVVFFALCSGAMLATISGSRAVAAGSYLAGWVGSGVGSLLFPALSVFDITGRSLDAGFFQLTSIPGQSEFAAAQQQILLYQRLSPVFLLVATGASAVLLFIWLSRRWGGDWGALLSGSRSHDALGDPRVGLRLELGVAKLGAASIALVLSCLTALLAATSSTPDLVAPVAAERLVPILFATAYAGIFTSDQRAKVIELTLSTRRSLRPYLVRLVFVTLALFAAEAIQAVVWSQVADIPPASLLAAGLFSGLLFGGIAFLSSVLTGSFSAAMTIVATTWTLLQLPAIVERMRPLGYLSPFHGDIATLEGLGGGSSLVALIGVMLVAMGLQALRRTERRVSME